MSITPVIPAPRDLDAEQQRDIERFERAVAQYLAGEISEDVFRVMRLNNGIYGQRQGGTNQMVRIKLPAGSDHSRAARPHGPPRRDVFARLGSHHDTPERADPLRRAHQGDRRDARPRLGRPDHSRGVRRHGSQRHGLPPRRRLPARVPRRHPVGRGRVPTLRAQPAGPAPAAQVQDQLLAAARPIAVRRCSTTSA